MLTHPLRIWNTLGNSSRSNIIYLNEMENWKNSILRRRQNLNHKNELEKEDTCRSENIQINNGWTPI